MKKNLRNIELIEKMIEEEYKNQKKYGLTLRINNVETTIFLKGRDKSWKLRILEHSRKNFFEKGVFNELRNCYYPLGKNSKDIEECNKLEKMFNKWGFKSLQ